MVYTPIRRVALIVSMLALQACGFQPVHGTRVEKSLDVNLAQVSIQTDGSRLGQLLAAEIRDQANPDYASAPATYALHVSFTESDNPLFINPDGTSGRGDMQYQSHYSLVRLTDNKSISTGNINRVASYNTSQNADYASFVSREDARKRAIVELAQDYKLRLINLLPKMNDPNAEEVAPSKPEENTTPNPFPQDQSPYETRRPGF